MSERSHPVVPADEPFDEAFEQLNGKQKLYLENRIKGLGPKPAAIAAGYSPQSAKTLETHPRIKKVMLEINKTALHELALTRQDVLAGFMDAVDSSSTATELVMAWREIGKVIGAYEPEVVLHKYKDITPEQIRDLDDDALLEMAAVEDYRLLPPPSDSGEDIVDAELVDEAVTTTRIGDLAVSSGEDDAQGC